MNANPQGGNAPPNTKKNEGRNAPYSPPNRSVNYTLAPVVGDGRKCNGMSANRTIFSD